VTLKEAGTGLLVAHNSYYGKYYFLTTSIATKTNINKCH